MSRPGARPAVNTPKEKTKHKINQQNKTGRRKKFRSFSSSLAGTHNSSCVTDGVTVGRSQGPEGQPASSLQMAPALLLHVSPAGRAPLPLTPSPPLVLGGAVPLQLRRWGRRKERVSRAPRGESGQGKVRKVTAQRWRWYFPSGSSLLLGYLQEEKAKGVKSSKTIATHQIPKELTSKPTPLPSL